MLTRWSPQTVMRLPWLPSSGNEMKVPLSTIAALMSSSRSVRSQSSLRGRIGVSREMTDLVCSERRKSGKVSQRAGVEGERDRAAGRTHADFVARDLVEHVPGPLDAEELAGDPYLVERRAVLRLVVLVLVVLLLVLMMLLLLGVAVHHAWRRRRERRVGPQTVRRGREAAAVVRRRCAVREIGRRRRRQAHVAKRRSLRPSVRTVRVGRVRRVRRVRRLAGQVVRLVLRVRRLGVQVGRVRERAHGRVRRLVRQPSVPSVAVGRRPAELRARRRRRRQSHRLRRGHERGRRRRRDAAQRRREVDVGSRLLLDRLDDVPLAPGEDRVQLVVDRARLGVQAGLAETRRARGGRARDGSAQMSGRAASRPEGRERTSSSSMTSSWTLATSTAPSGPSTRISHRRSVSSPKAPLAACALEPGRTGAPTAPSSPAPAPLPPACAPCCCCDADVSCSSPPAEGEPGTSGLTTLSTAPVWTAIVSSLCRTGGLSAHECVESGLSRISDRATLSRTWYCGAGRGDVRGGQPGQGREGKAVWARRRRTFLGALRMTAPRALMTWA